MAITSATVSPPSSLRRMPPQLYFVGSAVFHYLGPAFAVLLFVRLAPVGVAWLRIALAAVVFILWRRPWRVWPATREVWRLLVGWAVVLAAMNTVFYLAIDRLPLGTVAAIEFLPVIVLAAIAVRSLRNLTALLAATVGVYLLADVQLRLDPLGVLFAGTNAVLFAGYVVLAHKASRQPGLEGIDGLAWAMVLASIAAIPIGIAAAVPALVDLRLLGAALGVAVCSSVVPYVCDQLAMARLSRATYALLVSLLPAIATVIGFLILGQIPRLVEVIAVVLVVSGVALHRPDPTA